MATVMIVFRDERGTVRLEDRGRPGGSYAQTVRSEIGFIVVKDAYGEEKWFPAQDIKEIVVEAGRGGW